MEIPQTVSAQMPPFKEEKKTSEKNTFILKAIFTLFLFLLLPFIFLLSNETTKNQDIRSKATKISVSNVSKILFVPFSFSHDQDDDVLLEFKKKPEIRNGFIPVNQLSGKGIFTATLLDKDGKQIVSTSYSPPDRVAIDGIEAVSQKEHAELKKVAANDYGFSLPYYPDAVYLRISNPQGNIVANIALKNISSINNLVKPEEVNTDLLKDKIESRKKENQERFKQRKEKSTNLNLGRLLPQTFAASGTFNLAILGDNYGGNIAQFQTDVNDIVTGLLSVEPFASNKANIVFYPQLSTATICVPASGWPAISCNDTEALQQASSIPYDKIYVLYNGPYTGYAYVGGILAYGTSSTDRSVAVKQGLFVHELAGHALGGLMDEYSYGTTGASYAPNCLPSTPCSAWEAFAGLGCFSTCGYTNLYRATENNSAMNTAFLNGILSFDAYSTQIVQNQLSSYFSAAAPTPVPTSVFLTPSPTLAPSPTVTPPPPSPSPTPTAVPTPTPTSTIARFGLSTLTDATVSTVTPSFTPTNIVPTPTVAPTQILPSLPFAPSPTLVPTSTVIPTNVSSCTFPNYCTLVKYCSDDRKLIISCGRSDQVCCQPQEEPKKKETVATNVFTPLPTAAIVPTSPPSLGSLFQPPQSAGQQIVQISPTSSVVVRQPSTTPSFQTLPKVVTTTPIAPIPTQIQITAFPPPTEIISPSPFFVSPTPFNPETFEFERATPTPSPAPSLLGTLGSVFSNFLRSLLPGLFR